MSFKSILSNVGHGLAIFFKDSVKVAQIAEPIIAVAFPGIGTLFAATVNEVAKVEALAIAAGSQTGSGGQKLALVMQSIQAEYAQYAQANGLPVEPANVQAWINAVVAVLNSVPSGAPTP